MTTIKNKTGFYIRVKTNTFLMSLLLVTLTSCGQNNLMKRWIAAGEYRKGNVVPKFNHTRECEFLKNGKFSVYEDGDLQGTGNYTVAADAKSILLKDGNQNGTLKIFKLAANELILVFPRNDTVVYYPSTPANAKKVQTNSDNYNKLIARWSDLSSAYGMRNGPISNLPSIVSRSVDMNNEIFSKLSATEKAIKKFRFDLITPTDKSFKQYESLQDEYAKEFAELIELLKAYPAVTKTTGYKHETEFFTREQQGISTYRSAFIKSFNSYHGKQILALE